LNTFVFVATLGHSRRLHVRAFRAEKQEHWFAGLESAFSGATSQTASKRPQAAPISNDAAPLRPSWRARGWLRHLQTQERRRCRRQPGPPSTEAGPSCPPNGLTVASFRPLRHGWSAAHRREHRPYRRGVAPTGRGQPVLATGSRRYGASSGINRRANARCFRLAVIEPSRSASIASGETIWALRILLAPMPHRARMAVVWVRESPRAQMPAPPTGKSKSSIPNFFA
jgi:hypothetical protein